MNSLSRSRIAATAALFLLFLLHSCGGATDGDAGVLEFDIYGFRLGEKKDDLFERIRYITSWEETEPAKGREDTEAFIVWRTPDRSRDVESARLSFYRGRLMEVIVYFRMKNVSKLNSLKAEIEESYGVYPTSPDGTIEMAYKTYWYRKDGMSITLRRITKKPETELYIQYFHIRLHELMKAGWNRR